MAGRAKRAFEKNARRARNRVRGHEQRIGAAARRAREAMEQLPLHRYRVRVWTAFEWEYPEGSGKAIAKQREAMRKKNEQDLEYAAPMLARKLAQVNDGPCQVKRVGVKRKPQLLFELEIGAFTWEAAERAAHYRIGRALAVKVVPKRKGATVPQKRTLTAPLGKTESERIA